MSSPADLDALKAQAARLAAELVQPGMLIGIGTGSTTRYFTEALGARVAQGLQIRAVVTSNATASLARSVGIEPLLGSDVTEPLDLAVDGADEIDPSLRLTKGAGGALTREKLVAAAAQRFVVVADESKLVDRLGRGPLRVEVLPFFWRHTAERLEHLGGTTRLWGGLSEPFVTDNGNWILDLQFADGIPDPEGLAIQISQVPGVVEHGLFIGLATACIVAGREGVKILGSLT